MNDSLYFQADVTKELAWLVSATLKYSDHVAFYRAIKGAGHRFEFFVAPDLGDVFLDIMAKLEKIGAVKNLEQLESLFVKKS